MILTLPWPPTINTYYTIARNRKILSKKGREYQKEALQHIADTVTLGEPLTGRLSVKICLAPPDRRIRDIDNYLKAPLDVLTKAAIWCDDSQIKTLHVIMEENRKGGRVGIIITQDEG